SSPSVVRSTTTWPLSVSYAVDEGVLAVAAVSPSTSASTSASDSERVVSVVTPPLPCWWRFSSPRHPSTSPAAATHPARDLQPPGPPSYTRSPPSTPAFSRPARIPPFLSFLPSLSDRTRKAGTEESRKIGAEANRRGTSDAARVRQRGCESRRS